MHRELANTIKLFEQGLERSNRPEDRKVVADYLAALGPILALAVLGEDVLARLLNIERLFGNTWVVDAELFEEAFSSWRRFKDDYEKFALGGMTVKERLYALGLDEAFDRACLSRDFTVIEKLLRQSKVDSESILKIIGKVRTGNG